MKKVEIFWINLHDQKMLDAFKERVSSALADGYEVEFLQSGTFAIAGTSPDFNFTPVTALTAIIRWSRQKL